MISHSLALKVMSPAQALSNSALLDKFMRAMERAVIFIAFSEESARNTPALFKVNIVQ